MKLKKLVLCGFKSFADRTEFEFDDGITCVVGPNGCGKSNVVDAFKWVLGSQSAKSLRGTEMSDVIFNGSSSRRPSGMAEVCLTFDNTQGILQNAVAEEGCKNSDILSITRRLYRSGLSEYLINNTPCRLKDIKEMFMDTGVGVDAYSLIEQGKVEVFLQASQDERRAIFDEAAGISKYKARKKEALRKLERVEQNLLRLNDIVSEVEKRLRSIKYQAGKARSYQAYSQQLKELRSLHFLAQYHTMTIKRTSLKAQHDSATDTLSGVAARIDQLEAARSASEVEAVDLERTARELQGRIASLSGQITTCQERTDMLQGRIRELDEQVLAALSRSEAVEARIEAAQAEITERQALLARLEQDNTELVENFRTAREAHAAGELAAAQLQAALEDEKAGTIDIFRRTAQLHNEINGLGIRRENLHGQKTRLTSRAGEIEHSLRGMLSEKGEYEGKLAEVKELIAASTARLEETRANSRRVHDSEQQLRGELSEARERRSAVTSRIQTLQEMQDRLEGVASGVRRAVEAHKAGKLPCLRGMLGDFLQTDTAHAAMVEAALAGADQQLLVDRAADLTGQADALRAALGGSAAVEVVCLDRLGPLGQDFQPADCPQARGRVIDHVRFEGPLAPLMWRLLGTTLMVDTLADALAAAGAAPAGFRFVTQAGEVLEADGRVRFGAANRGAGVITRRSELAELHAERAALVERIEQLETQCTSAHNELQHLDELQHGLRTAVYEANTDRVECQSRLGQLDEQVESLRREQPVVAKDIEAVVEDIDGTIQAEGEARQKAEELEELNRQRQAQIQQIEQRIAEARLAQQEVTNRMTEMKVALAAVDEKKRSAREALDGVVRAAQAMRLDLDKDRAQIDLDRQRKADAQSAIEKAAGEVERLFAEQQQLNIEAAEVEESRAGLQQKLEEIRVQLTEKRKAHTAAQDALGAIKIELGEVDVRVENLISRAGEEMSMDLLELCKNYQHDEQRDWAAVEAEIQDLRTKIEHLGNVNLDAIAEQEELDKRREFMTTQVKDIQDSHQQLNDLIRKINQESKDMFLETFEAVRQQFQILFRKLFGGGKADIIMLDPDNVLECGIEIIARPPGKETRSLSLLSGGEKTMTALSLMFSIFRCRPSPFCLLDEVDAALDEQNTERFTRLVGEFVDTSQFLVISHSKRTMSICDVLYGVTMQEPGVSKRISVRFEEAGKSVDEQLEPAGVS